MPYGQIQGANPAGSDARIPFGSPIAPQGGAVNNPYGGGSMLNTIMGPATAPLYGGGFAAPGTGGNPYAGGSYPGAKAAGNPYASGTIAGSSMQDQTIQNNLKAGPDLQSIMGLINSINLNAQQQANAGRIPGSQGLEAQSSQNIGSALGGQLPQDVVSQLSQLSAERGVSTGSPGSPNANASLLRSLGLTSLGLQGQGQQWLSAANARNPVAPIGDPLSQLLTPAQQGQLGLGQAALGLDWYKLLNQPKGGSQSGGGQPTGNPAAPDNSWWNSLFRGGAGSPAALAPPSGAGTYNTRPGWDNTDWGLVTGGSVPDMTQQDWGYVTGGSQGYNPFASYDSGELGIF